MMLTAVTTPPTPTSSKQLADSTSFQTPIIQQPQSIANTSLSSYSSSSSSSSSSTSSTASSNNNNNPGAAQQQTTTTTTSKPMAPTAAAALASTTTSANTGGLISNNNSSNNNNYLAVPAKSSTGLQSSSSGNSLNSSAAVQSQSYTDECNLKMAIIDYADILRLVKLQSSIDYHEWLAFNTKMYFDQINVLYGAIADNCTLQTCPTMSAPANTVFHWLDEKNKKFKYSASQYIDTVLTYAAKTISDETLFPTKVGHPFPAHFEQLVKKVHKHYFHILAHMYHCHYKELLQLKLNAYLNSIYFHFYLFNKSFNLLDDKDLEIMEPLNKNLLGKYLDNSNLASLMQHHLPHIHSPASSSSSSASASTSGSGSLTSSGFSFLKKKLNFNLMA